MGTVLSYPKECSGLKAEFLVYIARTFRFSYLVRQEEPGDDLSPGRPVPVVNANWYANVKTTTYLLSHF